MAGQTFSEYPRTFDEKYKIIEKQRKRYIVVTGIRGIYYQIVLFWGRGLFLDIFAKHFSSDI